MAALFPAPPIVGRVCTIQNARKENNHGHLELGAGGLGIIYFTNNVCVRFGGIKKSGHCYYACD